MLKNCDYTRHTVALSPGDKLGSCEILDLLGKGGMGEVYRGRDARLGREVAVKSLPDAFADDPERVARFEREAQTLGSLNHPNIAAIYEFKEFGGSQYLILELVEGQTLAERLERGALSIDDSLEVARQIAEALEAAHDKGIVHRDLKPANVKITPEGRVKVLDFGLAKAMEPASSSSARQPAVLSNSPTLSALQTAGGVILGTAGYMSPEQARGKTVDRRTDVWGFGCVLYEMLAGRAAFPNGETPSDTLAAVLTREPAWNALPSTTPLKIRALIERCLRKDVRRRLRDIGDALVEIEDLRDAPALPAATPAPIRSRQRMWAALAGIFFLAAAGTLAAFFLWDAPMAPETPTVRFEVMPPEHAGSINYVHLSPDGRKLAFSTAARGDTKPFIWIRPLDSSAAQPLASTEGAAPVFFWSADSQFIAFSSQGKLKKAAISGGPAITLANLPPGPARTGTWNDDGVILLQGTTNANTLLRVSAAGGDLVPETELDAAKKEQTHFWPNFLPDGRHYFFLVRSLDPQYSVSYVGTLGSKERRALPGIASEVKYSSTGHVLFIRNGALMTQPFDATRLELSGEATPVADPFVRADLQIGPFSASLTGSIAYWVRAGETSQLTWFNRSGNRLGIAGPKGEFDIPELSADGKFVVFGRQAGIWTLDIDKALVSRLTSNGGDSQPQWSSTGRSVIFEGTRSGVSGIYERPFGVIGEDKLVSNHRGPSDWSRDGRYIVYNPGGDIRAIALSSGDRTELRVTETSTINETYGKISPDGQWIAYQSSDAGTTEVFIQSFLKGGLKQQVSTSGGFQPRWNPNGQELFYVTNDSVLMSVSTKLSGSALAVGAPVRLFALPVRPNTRGNYNVSPDGRFLVRVVSEEDREASPITVILNWASGLK